MKPRGGERRTLRGHATLTHRWVERLESRVVERRREAIAVDGERRVYLVEDRTTSGDRRSWLRVDEAGRTLHAGPVGLEGPWEAGGAPIRLIEGLLRGRIEPGPERLRVDPLAELPGVVRWAVAPFLRWQSSWRSSLFELDLRARPGGPLTLRGQGLVHVTTFEAASEAPASHATRCERSCADAAHGCETCPETAEGCEGCP